MTCELPSSNGAPCNQLLNEPTATTTKNLQRPHRPLPSNLLLLLLLLRPSLLHPRPNMTSTTTSTKPQVVMLGMTT